MTRWPNPPVLRRRVRAEVSARVREDALSVIAQPEPDTPSFAQPWGAIGAVTDLDGPVHWVEFGGPADAVPLVLVHGLGGSHLNWVQVGPQLARRSRVIALDLAGFGLTPAQGRATSVRANAALLDRFLHDVVGRPAVLVGNSMGGMVSLLHAAAHPHTVAGLVLVDPSVPVPRQVPDIQVAAQFFAYAVPVLGERVLARGTRRLTDRQRVQRVIDLCFADPQRACAALVEASTGLAAHRRGIPGQDADFLQAARSLMRVLARPRRYAALIDKVTCPVLLIHGEQDRLVPLRAAQAVAAANPHWQTAYLPGVGHTPQLEVPDLVVHHLNAWLDRGVGVGAA